MVVCRLKPLVAIILAGWLSLLPGLWSLLTAPSGLLRFYALPPRPQRCPFAVPTTHLAEWFDKPFARPYVVRREVFRMKTKMLGAALVVSLVMLGFSLYAQVTRPFHPGTVWVIQFIRVKPGMDNAYKNWLASDWKKEQEAFKASGLILGYKVLETESHSPNDYNMMLMTEVKDMATAEANEQKMDALAQQVMGSDQQQQQGYKDRESMREPLATRMAREVVLSPR
jgi:hypothetical protein